MSDDRDIPPVKGDLSDPNYHKPDDLIATLESELPGASQATAPFGMAWTHSVAFCGPPPEIIRATRDKPIAPGRFAKMMAQYRQLTFLAPTRQARSRVEHEAACAAWEAEAAEIPAIQDNARRKFYELHPDEAPLSIPEPEPYIDRSANFRFTVRVVGSEPSPDSGIRIAPAPKHPITLEAERRLGVHRIPSHSPPFRGTKC